MAENPIDCRQVGDLQRGSKSPEKTRKYDPCSLLNDKRTDQYSFQNGGNLIKGDRQPRPIDPSLKLAQRQLANQEGQGGDNPAPLAHRHRKEKKQQKMIYAITQGNQETQFLDKLRKRFNIKNQKAGQDSTAHHSPQKLQTGDRNILTSCVNVAKKGSKCLRHPNNCDVQHLLVCLEESCHESSTPAAMECCSVDSSAITINVKHKCRQQENTTPTKDKTSAKVAPTDCKLPDKTQQCQGRVFCIECVAEYRHRGHFATTLGKLQEAVHEYHWASLQATRTVLSKIHQLRINVQRQISLLQAKAVEIMTLGIVGQECELRQKQSARQRNRKYSCRDHSGSNADLYQQLSFFKNNHQSKQKFYDPGQNLQRVFTAQGLRTWRGLLANTSSVNKVLSYKQQCISEQIQDVCSSIEAAIDESIYNLEFIDRHKERTFSPDDMHPEGVGLSLSRNRLECLGTASSCLGDNEEGEMTKAEPELKLAFTEIALATEHSISFRIEKLKKEIMVGCVSAEGRNAIAGQLCYQNFEHLVSGLSVQQDGQATLHSQGQPGFPLEKTRIRNKDIIQLTWHHKQNTLIISKYSIASEAQLGRSTSSGAKSQRTSGHSQMYRTVLAVLNLEFSGAPTIHAFAAVAGEGDSVSIVENLGTQGHRLIAEQSVPDQSK